MTSTIEITFNCDLNFNEYVEFERKFNDDFLSTDWNSISEKWKSLRIAYGEVTIGTPTGIAGERSAINYAQSLTLDIPNPVGTSNIYVIGNIVRITHSSDWQFREVSGGTPSCVSISISNFDSDLFNINNLVYSSATVNPNCSHYKVEVNTNQLATSYTLDGNVVTGNVSNPIVFEKLRGVGFSILVDNGNDQTYRQSRFAIQVPSIFTSSQIRIQINNSPSGSSVLSEVIESNTFGYVYTYEYSLNGTEYQSSGVFNSLLNGSYTMYVRDNLGCIQTLDFNIADGNIVNPFTYMSESSSLRFGRQISEDVCGPYKKDRDKLSCEEYAEDKTLVYPDIIRYQKCDNIEIQHLSNYDNVNAFVIKEDGTEDVLIANKLTGNINRKDSRSARAFNYGIGRMGVYFLSGKIYDFDTGADTGNEYILNGSLPEWGKIGGYINVNNIWYTITQIIYDENRNAEALIFDGIWEVPESSVVAKSIFNREVYEVYEFSLPFTSYNNQCIRVRVENTDTKFEDDIYVSELIDIKDFQERTVEIISYNDKNTDVFYKTGIQHKIRQRITSIKGEHDGDSEVLKADTKSDLLSANLYQIELYEFEPVSKGRYRQLVQLLSHKYVFINGERFVINDTIEKEGPLGKSNQYVIKASMLRSTEPYTAQITGAETLLINPDENIEVPNFIAPESDEFVSY